MPSKPSDRRRKISLQNDYAYGIISPIGSATVLPSNLNPHQIPVSLSSSSSSLPVSCNEFAIISLDQEEDIEIGEEASLVLLGPHMNTPNRGFRRWSLCNFQEAGQPVYPSMAEDTAGNFVSDENLSSRMSYSSSSASLNWIAGIICNIPDRIRKVSVDRNKFNVQARHKDGVIREQLKKMIVY
jgi:hypothetical protein